MKRFFTSITLLSISLLGFAQSFTDDFEAYTSGSYIAQSSSNWTTWQNKPGTNQDVKVVNDDAFSGSNSLYLSATSGAETQDLVLPFGGKYDIGQFEFEMMLKLKPANGSYMNWQAETKVGTTWALNFETGKDGSYRLYNDNEIIMEGKCPMDQWFNLKLDLDLSMNKWTLLIDNEAQGTWTNSANAIASLNLYPTNNIDENGNSAFWVDDVKYTYTAPNLTGTNLAILGASTEGAFIAGLEVVASAQIRNLGLDAISSAKIKMDYNGNSVTETFSALALSSGQIAHISFADAVTLANQEMEITFEILEVNGNNGDDNAADNKAATSLNPVVPAADKMVILEEGTGTWCGWCPRGTVSLEQLEEKYGDLFQGIAVHSGDPMENPFYTEPFVNAYIPGFPSGQMDRSTTLGMTPGQAESAFLDAIAKPAISKMALGAAYNESTKTITVSVEYTFKEAVQGNWAVGCVLVENGVTGTESGYNQANYYAGGSNGEMFGWENKPSTVPASQMVYNDVARAISPSLRGARALPTSISANESFVFQFTFTVAEGWNTDNLQLVALCYKPDNTIDNGSSATLANAISNGLAEGEVIAGTHVIKNENIKVYPNPANGSLFIAGTQALSYELINSQGQTVLSQAQKSAQHELNVSELAAGIYFVKLYDGENFIMKKVILQ